MDINCTIKFIKSSRGLCLDKKIFYKIFILFPIMFLLVMVNAQELERSCIIISGVILLFILVADFFYLFTLIKSPLTKHKFLLIPAILFNCIFPLFYISCLTFYNFFGMKNFLLFYLLPFSVIFFVFLFIGFVLSFRVTRKKAKTSYSVLCGVLLGLGVLISRKTNDLMAERLNEQTHFLLIAVLMLLINCFAASIAFFDLLRYCYFIKLEKAEIVTEDILKQ